MPSLPARALRLYSRLMIKRDGLTRDGLVHHLRRQMDNPPPLPAPVPRGVRFARFSDGRIQGDWLQVKTASRAILYLHGGGYIAGVTKTYHALCAKLAAELDADVFLPEYRLAPEHPFPAAVEDAAACYDMLLAHGWDPKHILIAGDSAGGGLTLGTLLKLRDDRKPMPAAAVVFSPYADLTISAASHAGNDATDAMLSADMIATGDDLYVRKPGDRHHPYASPVLGDYTGLPPLLVTVDEEECLRDDAHAVVARAKEAGVPVSLIARRGVVHVWPVFYPLLPEARSDLKKVTAFVREVVRPR